MVVVKDIHVRRRGDGKLEAEAIVSATSGDSITSADMDVNTIEAVTAVIPLVASHVVTGVAITNPGSYNNSFTITAYSVSGGSLVTMGGSIDWFIKIIGE